MVGPMAGIGQLDALAGLPLELRMAIFGHLRLSQRVKLRTMCRSFRHAIDLVMSDVAGFTICLSPRPVVTAEGGHRSSISPFEGDDEASEMYFNMAMANAGAVSMAGAVNMAGANGGAVSMAGANGGAVNMAMANGGAVNMAMANGGAVNMAMANAGTVNMAGANGGTVNMAGANGGVEKSKRKKKESTFSRKIRVKFTKRNEDRWEELQIRDEKALISLLNWATPNAESTAIEVMDCHSDPGQLSIVLAVFDHLISLASLDLHCSIRSLSLKCCFILRKIQLWTSMIDLASRLPLRHLQLTLCGCIQHGDVLHHGHGLHMSPAERRFRRMAVMRRLRTTMGDEHQMVDEMQRWRMTRGDEHQMVDEMQRRGRTMGDEHQMVDEMQRFMQQRLMFDFPQLGREEEHNGHGWALFNGENGDENGGDEDGGGGGDGSPPDGLISSRRIVDCLQKVLNASPQLEIVDVDGILSTRSLPLTALRYPPMTRRVVSSRMSQRGSLAHVLSCCPMIEKIDHLEMDFIAHPSDVKALVSATGLRSLHLSAASTGNIRLNDLGFAAFGAKLNAHEMRRPWPNLVSMTMQIVQPTFLRQLCLACPSIETLHLELKSGSSGDISEAQMLVVTKLCNLRELVINDMAPRSWSDAFLDGLGEHCPRLHRLRLSPCRHVTLLALPRLLSRCKYLRYVELPDLVLNLGTLDCNVTLMSIAYDLRQRQHVTQITLLKVHGETYVTVGRIMEALATQEENAQLLLSTMSDSCIHNRDKCVMCCFDGHSISGESISSRTSLTLSLRRRPMGVVVFTSSISLSKSGGIPLEQQGLLAQDSSFP